LRLSDCIAKPQAIFLRWQSRPYPGYIGLYSAPSRNSRKNEAMPAKIDPATDLAARLLSTLEEQRRQGAVYPLTVRRLVELTDPAATEALVLKAVAKKKPFGERAVVAQPKTLNAPLALVEDTEQLAASPLLLEFVLGTLCSESQPALDLAKVKKAKLATRLKKPFEAALLRAVHAHALPPTVALVKIKNKPHLHLTRFPLVREPEEELAEVLVQTLQAQRERGEQAYPLTIPQLVQLARPEADGALLARALAQPAFKEAVVLAWPKDPATPLALAEDAAQLAGSALVLETVLRRGRVERGQALPVAALKKLLPGAPGRMFEQAVGQQVAERCLPGSVGAVWRLSGKKRETLLFLLEDVGATVAPVQEAPPRPAVPVAPEALPAPAAPPGEFGRLFEQAFADLDRQAGTHNLVSLVELRARLPHARPVFDAELLKLRQEGRFVLKLAEGRHGLSPAEQAAALVEEGRLLLYVARKLS